MSEKIKGMFGSETRADEVLEWLKSQGAEEHAFSEVSEEDIYFVDQGQVKIVSKEHAVLFDIVELPRWRAKEGELYYFMSDYGECCNTYDMNTSFDNERHKIGNYFRTAEEMEPYKKKFREVFKEKKEG